MFVGPVLSLPSRLIPLCVPLLSAPFCPSSPSPLLSLPPPLSPPLSPSPLLSPSLSLPHSLSPSRPPSVSSPRSHFPSFSSSPSLPLSLPTSRPSPLFPPLSLPLSPSLSLSPSLPPSLSPLSPPVFLLMQMYVLVRQSQVEMVNDYEEMIKEHIVMCSPAFVFRHLHGSRISAR